MSPAIGGWMAQGIGYGPMFLILGSFAFGSIALWVAFSSLLKPACAGTPAQGTPSLPPAGATA